MKEYSTLLMIPAGGVLLLIFALVVNLSMATGEVHHCLINGSTVSGGGWPAQYQRYWRVEGVRYWRSNVMMGEAATIDEAIEIATKANCRVGLESK
jgi:hypothetical protein